MSHLGWTVVCIVISYLLGSVSFSYLMGRLKGGIDIRKHGSGNAGATNTLRVLGAGPAILVLALDIGKGIGVVWLAYGLTSQDHWAPILSGVAVIAGHNWPVFFGFRGGKGVATTIGATATLFFLPALYAGIIGIGAVIVTRYVSLGSLLYTAFMPIFLLVLGYRWELIVFSLMIAAFAWYRHKSNIVKLAKGQENKLGRKSPSAKEAPNR